MKIWIDNESYEVEEGTSVAAAIVNAGRPSLRRSASGESRFSVCGMGICFECRVIIDGEAHQRSCQTTVRNGMIIETQ